MTVLRYTDVIKLTEKERQEKLYELYFELIKTTGAIQKKGAKTKEIKKAIARLLTRNKSKQEALNKK